MKKCNKGIALVEVIAALGLAAAVLTAMVSLTLFTVRSSLSSKLLLQGTKVATREAELIRAYRDTNASTWDVFVTAMQGCGGANTCCTAPGGLTINPGVCTEGTGVETITRYFTASVNGDVVNINITVSWVVGGVTKSTHLYTSLSNWR
jgi:Tfp pilus assembly protein PilV